MLENHFWELFAKKLTGEATARELREIEDLMRTYPHLHYAAQPLEDLWKLEQIHPEDLDQKFADHLKKINLPVTLEPEPLIIGATSRPNWKWRYLAAAATLLIAILTGFFFIPDNNKDMATLHADEQTRQVNCPPGSKTKVLLPDSSTVWLNSGSRIVYNEGFGKTNRNLVLSGEAYFDVKKSLTPFIIKTANIQIKVLGTAFNVRSYPHEKKTETALIHGSVEILLDKRPDERIVLKPNEKITINNQEEIAGKKNRPSAEPLIILGSVTTHDDSSIAETQWIENKLVFQSESFGDLAMKMEARYGVRFRFASEALKNRRFTGVFGEESITEALEALQYSSPFQFTISGNVVTISQK
jgi:transmembrane sensor